MKKYSEKAIEQFFELIVGWFSPDGSDIKKDKLTKCLAENPGIEYSVHILHGTAINYALICSLYFVKLDRDKFEVLKLTPELINLLDNRNQTTLYNQVWHSGYDFHASQYDSMGQMIMKPVLESDFAKIIFLLENGADPNIPDDEGLTPLHVWAKARNEERYAQALVEHGANINQQDGLKRTPLHYTCRITEDLPDRIPETVETLIKLGADSNIVDVKCLTSLDYLLQRMDQRHPAESYFNDNTDLNGIFFSPNRKCRDCRFANLTSRPDANSCYLQVEYPGIGLCIKMINRLGNCVHTLASFNTGLELRRSGRALKQKILFDKQESAVAAAQKLLISAISSP